MRIRCQGVDGEIRDIDFTEKTKVSEVKQRMAQVKNIPNSELENYGIFITTKEDAPLTSAETTNEDLWIEVEGIVLDLILRKDRMRLDSF